MPTDADSFPHPGIAPEQLGHIPTVKIMELTKAHFRKDEIAEWVERERQGYPESDSTSAIATLGGAIGSVSPKDSIQADDDQHFWEAMAVEFGCRELLARYWFRLSAKERGDIGPLRSISPRSFEG